jgi:hypothetical protein
VLTPLGELGTDPAMAERFAERVGRSGPAEGRFKTYLVSPDRFGSEGGGVEFLRYAVAGVIYYNLLRDPFGTLSAINAGRDFGEAVLSPAVDLPQAALAQLHFAGTPEGRPAGELVYKARPLDGIWATAPYLHNGSVRTLRQLLLPADKRQKSFHVGSREYDPKEVGFVDTGGFLFDTSLPGNSNAGHEYGADALSRDPGALDALLEYLKTL